MPSGVPTGVGVPTGAWMSVETGSPAEAGRPIEAGMAAEAGMPAERNRPVGTRALVETRAAARTRAAAKARALAKHERRSDGARAEGSGNRAGRHASVPLLPTSTLSARLSAGDASGGAADGQRVAGHDARARGSRAVPDIGRVRRKRRFRIGGAWFSRECGSGRHARTQVRVESRARVKERQHGAGHGTSPGWRLWTCARRRGRRAEGRHRRIHVRDA